MEGNSQDLSPDSGENQKAFVAVKRRKLERVPYPDEDEISKTDENFATQSATDELTNRNRSESKCESNNFDSDVSPQEFVFSIDNVLEQILSSLDLTDLFHCRLVSHKWRITSTEMILRRVGTTILFKYNSTDQVYYFNQSTAEDKDAAHKSTLEDLTRFLKETYYSPTSSLKMIEFPGQVFKFVDGSLSNPQLQRFLKTFGEYVYTLVLEFSNSLEGETEANLLKRIGHLLNTQAPHMRNLNLFCSSKLPIIETDDSHHPAVSSTDTGISPPLQVGQESMAIKGQGQSGLRQLNYLNCHREILDYIISISPNLQEISLLCQDYHYLSSPLNRLHFLKEFDHYIDDDEIFHFENFKLIEAALCVSNDERENQKLPLIKFTDLIIDFDNIVELENPDIQSSFVRVISKILELSWDTLESISFTNLEQDTLSGLQWPRVLPNVCKLELCLETANGSGLKLLAWSGSLKIQETFPKLKRLKFDEVIDYDGDVLISSPGKVLRNCKFGPAPNVESVEVTVYVYLDDDDVRSDVDVAEDVDRFRLDVTNSIVRLFPSAELIIKDKVYK